MAEILFNNYDDFKNGTFTGVSLIEEGRTVSTGSFRITTSSFAGKSVRTLQVQGLATPPENRRKGYVRMMLDLVQKKAVEEGAAVALLHTFSFSFYRKFGYEKVANHLIVRFPAEKIDFVLPEPCFVPCDPSMEGDLIKVYDEFSKGRNLLIKRKKYGDFTGAKKYICYIDGVPSAYVCFDTSVRFEVNRLTDTELFVREFAFVSKEALKKLFSFLRMFTGEFDTVEFSNCAMAPEIDMLLRHYNHTTYRICPDLEARVLDTKALLEANTYPEEEGCFTVKIADGLPSAAGTFKVSYGGGKAAVTKTEGGADIELSPGAFVRSIYGLDVSDVRFASFMDGVTVINETRSKDFFRAFPTRPGGVFEHF